MSNIKFQGNPLSLIGREIKSGMKAPDFLVVNKDLKEVRLSDFGNSIKVITFFPSLDTPVCDLQVKTFNKKAANLSDDVAVIGISKDLPFAQARFCISNGIEKIEILSDYKYSSFGLNYGILIKELELLARGVVIIDQNNIIRYFNYVDELTNEPNYEEALKALEDVLNFPEITI